jgi:hypothetical protein
VATSALLQSTEKEKNKTPNKKKQPWKQLSNQKPCAQKKDGHQTQGTTDKSY